MRQTLERTMRKRVLIAVVSAVVVVVCGLSYASVRWLDEKPWISYPTERMAIMLARNVYQIGPFATQDDDVVRTLKIAQFISIVDIETKSLDRLLLDLNSAQNLIANYLRTERDELNDRAVAALSLKRLIILNRMNAVMLRGGRLQSEELTEAIRIAKELVLTLDEGPVRFAMEKEIVLFDVEGQAKWAKALDDISDLGVAVDLYHFGLAKCVRKDESGGEYISKALQRIPREKLIEVTIRNVDHPLLAAASASAKNQCVLAVEAVYNQMGAKNG